MFCAGLHCPGTQAATVSLWQDFLWRGVDLAGVQYTGRPADLLAIEWRCLCWLQVPRSEMQAALALRFGGDGIVKMKGLPFKATADDVIK